MLRLLLSVGLSLCVTTALADDIEDAINSAHEAYLAQDYATATAQLDYASSLIRQLKAEGIAALFPDPLPGWEADEPDSNAAGGSMFGGGVFSSRKYHRGRESVTINYTSDSPMMQSVGIMFSNPSMVVMSGGKLKKIKGQQAIFRDDGRRPSLQMIVGGKVMVNVEGNTDAATLEQYAAAIDYAALAKQ